MCDRRWRQRRVWFDGQPCALLDELCEENLVDAAPPAAAAAAADAPAAAAAAAAAAIESNVGCHSDALSHSNWMKQNTFVATSS